MNPELSSEQASDLRYLDPKVPLLFQPSWANTLSQLFNKPVWRSVVGRLPVPEGVFAQATYVGMDVQAGPNVDIVGDAHRFASYL